MVSAKAPVLVTLLAVGAEVGFAGLGLVDVLALWHSSGSSLAAGCPALLVASFWARPPMRTMPSQSEMSILVR